MVQFSLQYFPWYDTTASLADTLHFNTNMVGVVKCAKTLRSFRACQGEHNEIYCKVIEIKKIYEYTKVKSPSTFIPLEHLNHSRKSVSISSVANSIRLKAVPLVLVGYYHLIYMPAFETNRLLIKMKGTTNKPCKMKHIYYVIQEGLQFKIWIQLAC